ncbi:MAG: Dabb family protein [Gammaproteobacteria bacterium]|jgi:hypothetical protein|nr:Dabb family protein [Gammaproteobacteria bacterium]MBT6754909.1 Dabb family protein [Gammaproteobacteria bacterium]MBT7524020.1 Dabb family protein [Gammaproteobacteria bacterium]MBT7814957.1 Dabb family protein [Gammaproteobacteria bacterium]MDA9896584.1 Dabb family protein [Gammaproteobacteria bacterium]
MKTLNKYIAILIIFGFTTSSSYAEEFVNEKPVYHVVLIWLKTYRNEMRINKVINASKELKNIPGVLEVSTGKVLRSARVIVDDTFDVSIIIKFASKEYLKDYLVHPIHIKIANEVIKPLANKITVYDTIIQE